jgi:hypothetical protein
VLAQSTDPKSSLCCLVAADTPGTLNHLGGVFGRSFSTSAGSSFQLTGSWLSSRPVNTRYRPFRIDVTLHDILRSEDCLLARV